MQASKRNRKFLAASPDRALVFVVECTARLYAFAAAPGRSAIVALPTDADVLGAAGVPGGVLVLTAAAAYFVDVAHLLAP